jgi:hypothetical protein
MPPASCVVSCRVVCVGLRLKSGKCDRVLAANSSPPSFVHLLSTVQGWRRWPRDRTLFLGMPTEASQPPTQRAKTRIQWAVQWITRREGAGGPWFDLGARLVSGASENRVTHISSPTYTSRERRVRLRLSKLPRTDRPTTPSSYNNNFEFRLGIQCGPSCGLPCTHTTFGPQKVRAMEPTRGKSNRLCCVFSFSNPLAGGLLSSNQVFDRPLLSLLLARSRCHLLRSRAKSESERARVGDTWPASWLAGSRGKGDGFLCLWISQPGGAHHALCDMPSGIRHCVSAFVVGRFGRPGGQRSLSDCGIYTSREGGVSGLTSNHHMLKRVRRVYSMRALRLDRIDQAPRQRQ